MSLNQRCCKKTSVTKIKVEEQGKKAVLLNRHKECHIVIKVDGCIISNQLAADWVVSKEAVADLIIELKGKGVEHAVKQVLATAEYWKANGYRQGRIAALIVANQYPKVSTSVRKAQTEFARLYQGPLHVVTKNFEGEMDAVLSFSGPHKI